MSKSNVPTFLLSVLITMIFMLILMYLFFPRYYTIPPLRYNRVNYVPPLPVYPSYVLQTRRPYRVRRGKRRYL